MNKLTFLNHTSYTAKTNNLLLIVDLWIEGYPVDKGL